jgi:hypothetical protein
MGIESTQFNQPPLFDASNNGKSKKKNKTSSKQENRDLTKSIDVSPNQAEKKEELGSLLASFFVLNGDFHYKSQDLEAIDSIIKLDTKKFPATEIARAIYEYMCNQIKSSPNQMNSSIGEDKQPISYTTKREILKGTTRSSNTLENDYRNNDPSKLVFNVNCLESLKAHSKKWIYNAENTLTELIRDLRNKTIKNDVLWRFLVLLKKGLDIHKHTSASIEKPKPR